MSEEKLNIRTRLERVALTADIASHYVQDMRVMPASGVARVAWDAMDHIEQMETAMRESALSELSALGQATEAYAAQKDAEAKIATAMEALAKAKDHLYEVYAGDMSMYEVQDEIDNVIAAIKGGAE
jgi:hypothetical protein